MTSREAPRGSDWERVEELFQAALDRPEASRAGFLDQACGTDAPLRERVEDLLREHGEDTDVWDDTRTPAPEVGRRPVAGALQSGERVGSYRVVEIIGEGGMGTVYEAVQDQPRRSVALKVMRADLSSPATLRRFEYESQVLGRLHHPGIAQVYDAGTFERDGRSIPYFAMELVPGACALVDHAREEALSIAERLHLFVRIAEAVQHGHAQGVLHRDLKPANILIDESGRPVVIDFGLARALEPDVGPQTTLTAAGHVMGTIAYMSPEQCRGDTTEVDIRSDVYSLGVLLHELLTGALPYPVTGKSTLEALRIVCDTPPAKLGACDRRYQGDLETILSKALEKDPARRYATANDLAADVTRFLDSEPILARPPTTLYQLRMFSRRHRALVASVVLAFFLLSGAVAVIVPLYLQTQRALDASVEENEKGYEVIQFLADMLISADPLAARGEALTVREMLDAAAQEIERKLLDRPAVRATIEDAIGATYTQLGMAEEARRHLGTAVELHREHSRDDPLLFVHALTHAGFLAIGSGDFERAHDLVDEGVTLLEELPRLPKRMPTLPARMLYVRGVLAARELRHADAERDFRDAYERADGLDIELSAMIAESIGNVFNQRGEMEEAVDWYERSISLIVEVRGEDAPDLGYAYGNLATVLLELGELERAEELSRRSLTLLEGAFGADHEMVALSRTYLAQVLAACGRFEEAEREFDRGLGVLRTVLAGHPELGFVELQYGQFLRASGRTEDAHTAFRRALEMTVEAAGAEHAITRSVALQVAEVYLDDGAYGEAESLLIPLAEILLDAEVAGWLETLYRGWHAAEPGAGHDEDLAHWEGISRTLEDPP